ncbi:hypothetical protein ACGF12_15870 [Kitasatospora sp. NPDC048296]|uniref:hypothetical protein n=1 Tax=Kitasatospora sp. NPDC048296 TaxID=3364048 RepID=UPI00371BA8D2
MEGWHPELRALIERADPDNSTLLSIRVVKPGERWASGPPGGSVAVGGVLLSVGPGGRGAGDQHGPEDQGGQDAPGAEAVASPSNRSRSCGTS